MSAQFDEEPLSPVELGGYYRPDPVLAEAVMRPSPTLNGALAAL